MALFSILIGVYKEFIIVFLLILIHELGHLLCAKLFKINTKKITLYPLGGISELEMDLNIDPKTEFLVLIMGPLFQCIAYELLVFLLGEKELIKPIHHGILSFNLLPIYPLDGGRIGNIIMNMFFPFRKAYIISIVISYLATIIILFSQVKFSINIIVIYCVLIMLIHKEELKTNLYFYKFILERLLKKYVFKKTVIVSHLKGMYRYKNNVIKEKNELIPEKEYLLRKYDKIKKNY